MEIFLLFNPSFFLCLQRYNINVAKEKCGFAHNFFMATLFIVREMCNGMLAEKLRIAIKFKSKSVKRTRKALTEI